MSVESLKSVNSHSLTIASIHLCLPLLPPDLQDSKGRSALHVSISMKQPRCSDILLGHPDIDLTVRDKHNQTPFATALAVKDNETGLAILKREPKAAEQVLTLVLLHFASIPDWVYSI